MHLYILDFILYPCSHFILVYSFLALYNTQFGPQYAGGGGAAVLLLLCCWATDERTQKSPKSKTVLRKSRFCQTVSC